MTSCVRPKRGKGQQVANVKRYGEARNALASDSLKVLQVTARDRRNVFEQLIEAVKYNSLGQISHALYDVGGEYRRNCRLRSELLVRAQ